MCGIVGYSGKRQNGGRLVFQGLKKLEYRGYDSWGVAVKMKGRRKLVVEKKIGKIGQARVKLPLASIALGHTRWATHGEVTKKNAHPHLDCKGQIAVVHNGIIENFRSLGVDLAAKGHSFFSETDTEIVAHLVEENLKKQKIKEAVFSCFKSLVGSNAIAVLDSQSETIIACRNGSPLVVGKGKDEFFLASDVTAFLKYTSRVYFLEDGEGVVIFNKKKLCFYDLKNGKEKKMKWQTIGWKAEDAKKGGFPHFLLKEIYEQKKTIVKTASLNEREIRTAGVKIKKADKVFLTGCGTAFHCALMGKYFFAKQGIEAEAVGAYEFEPFSGLVDEKSILVAVSQSGETADTLTAVKQAKKRGAKVVAVVNAVGSSLERIADWVIKVGSGPEIAVVSTKAFSAQVAILFLLAKAARDRYDEGQKQLKRLGEKYKAWLKEGLREKIIKLAKEILNEEHFYLIGKNLNYPAALEFALKIKETSYIHAEAFASGELKHGVISLIQKGTVCFVISGGDKKVEKEILSSAMELRARGARIIGVSTTKAEEFDYFIKTPDLGDLTILGNVIVGQMLGYYLGVGRGADPDKPRNLAKSVTVK